MTEEIKGNEVINDTGSVNSEPVLEEGKSRSYYVEKAKELRIMFPQNITTEKLKTLISSKIHQLQSIKSLENPTGAFQYQDMTALVRCRITCLNPAKKNWDGEIITAGNDNLPHISYYVPFNAVDGVWHLPRIIYLLLKEKKYYHIVEHSNSRDPRKYGIDIQKSKLVPEFLIEELPQLTQEELELLAQEQIANGSFIEDK